MSDQCCATVSRDNGWRFGQCSRNGVIERDGKWYCKQHDPVAAKERDDARERKWEEERTARALRDIGVRARISTLERERDELKRENERLRGELAKADAANLAVRRAYANRELAAAPPHEEPSDG